MGSGKVFHEPLSPAAFLDRSAHVYRDRPAVVDGPRRYTYGELADRVGRLAGALSSVDVLPGERVAVLAPNSHMALEATLGVPRAGGVLVALNTRLSAAELTYIVDHSGARVLLCDESLLDLGRDVVQRVEGSVRLIVSGPEQDEYEDLVSSAPPLRVPVEDEHALLSLNYTSGTTGRPKGVMYHHRGAYLQALAMAFHLRMGPDSRYLWTLPMFHCNGWCFPWAVTVAGARHVCLRSIDTAEIWRLIRDEGVTHLCAAPTVLTSIIHDAAAGTAASRQPITVATGGAPPSPALLSRAADLDIQVVHLYGLTETFGPSVVCDWWPEWDELPADQIARRKARQGVANVIGQELRVVDRDGSDVPRDGQTVGEIAIRGNNVMLGYYRDEEATKRAAPDGWFRTGDLGVMHPDGYVELRDRAKDIIISGGENIASVEVEQALSSHPAVLEAAVVAMADEKWGEVPVAFVAVMEGQIVAEDDLIEHLRSRLAPFKTPKRFVFGDLPKTSTGKVQKYVLRQRTAGL